MVFLASSFEVSDDCEQVIFPARRKVGIVAGDIIDFGWVAYDAGAFLRGALRPWNGFGGGIILD